MLFVPFTAFILLSVIWAVQNINRQVLGFVKIADVIIYYI